MHWICYIMSLDIYSPMDDPPMGYLFSIFSGPRGAMLCRQQDAAAAASKLTMVNKSLEFI